MLKVGVFHPVTQHSWQTALAFQEAGRLGWYATSVYYDPRRWPYRIERWLPPRLAGRLHAEFARRHMPVLDPDRVHQLNLREWLSAGCRRLAWHRFEHWMNAAGRRAFGRAIIRLLEREPVDVVWGYDSSSLEVFRWAKRRGIRCVLDQTIGHPASQNRVMLAERERHPEFVLDSYRPFDRAWIERQDEELALADLVVVGSEFCRATLIENGCPADKIRLAPYGADEAVFPKVRPVRPPLAGRPLEFLFVGSIEARKGMAYLLPAMRQIPPQEARLTLVGRMLMPVETFRRYADRVRHVPHVPRHAVVPYFLMADCFVFPSLFEGGGIVLYEACSAALGIIQSAMCGDGVRDGANGVVLPEVSVEALVREMQAVIADRGRLERWQEASWAGHGERSWAAYRALLRTLT
ncbi:MAG: glycosyltransferase family 4 protein [Rhodospirillaceae bacterium]|nr:glycosyltransferase family 4 protein [Rhodospirillaceae bacterium]